MNKATRKAVIAGNWKMNKTPAETTALINEMKPLVADADCDVVLCVPFIDIAAAVEADKAGKTIPDFFRRDLGFGTVHDATGIVAYLASDSAADISGQAIGIGGDRLQIWTHPQAAVSEFETRGWTYDALQSRMAEVMDGKLQSVGEKFPPLPPELDRSEK